MLIDCTGSLFTRDNIMNTHSNKILLFINSTTNNSRPFEEIVSSFDSTTDSPIDKECFYYYSDGVNKPST